MTEQQSNTQTIIIGDEILISEKKMTGETLEVAAKVVEVRTILGKQTYVVETEQGKRKVVGESQINKV